MSLGRAIRSLSVLSGDRDLSLSVAAFACAALSATAHADSVAQTLPFFQDWSNGGLITVNDNWSGVQGIEGYFLRNDGTTTAGVDPQTILGDQFGAGTTTVELDVIANQGSPNTLSNGGVAEFAIADPVVALNGSGTADAPFLLIHLDTTGMSSIRVRYNARDVDSSVDNSNQQVALHYRVGNVGSYTNVPAAYLADASDGPSLTKTTAVDVTLPAACDNQPLVQIRVMTTNATGNDEWIGIDDIQITADGACCHVLEGTCALETREDCQAVGGIFRGDGTDCTVCDGEFDLLETCIPPSDPKLPPPTFVNFGGGPESPPIPADFFYPGSQPFFGQVCYGGSGLHGYDTVVRRGFDPSAGIGIPENIPIEIVSLSLVSCQPITITGAQPDSFWDVFIELSHVATPPMGQMQTIKTHPNGGVFNAQFLVQPRFTFTNVDTLEVKVLDTGAFPFPPFVLPPIQFSTFNVPWVHIPHPSLNILSPLGNNFHPGIHETVPPEPASQVIQQWLNSSLPTGSVQHCVGPAQSQAPPTVKDEFCSTAVIEGFIDGFGPVTLLLAGDQSLGPTDSSVVRDAPPYTTGGVIDTELVQMELVGNSPFGPVFVHEDPAQTSPGQIVNVIADGGGNFVAGQGFFDVIIVIELPGLSQTLTTGGVPIHVQSPPFIELPPAGTTFASGPISVPLVNQDGETVGTITSVTHTVCQKVCVYEVTCVSGECGSCPLSLGDFVTTGEMCVDTCPDIAPRTCGDSDCCVSFALVGCLPWNVPLIPPGSACVIENTCCCTDTGAPEILCPSNTTAEWGLQDPVFTGFATAFDACEPVGIGWVDAITPTPGLCPQVAILTRTWTATDKCGHSSSCEQIITLVDTTPPEITCPGPVKVGTDPGECFATGVPLGTATATDNCSGVVISNNAPAVFPKGPTTVTWTATDICGLTDTCTQVVTVNDDEPPIIFCPLTDITVGTDLGFCDAVVTWTVPGVEDNCENDLSIVQTAGPAPGTVFPKGSTLIEYTATDRGGNTTICQFNVIVDDDEQPVITCPADITVSNDPGQCGAHVSWADPVVSDNCQNDLIFVQTGGPQSGDFIFARVGPVTVTYEATDRGGNTDTCSFTIEVTDDEPPVIVCPDDVTVQCIDDVPAADVNDALAVDNCDDTPIVTDQGDVDNGGAGCSDDPLIITRTYRATDDNGNFVDCTQIITVIDDVAPAIALCPDLEVNADAGSCEATIELEPPAATDNCDDDVEVNGTRDDGLLLSDPFPAGDTTITWVATDDCGNQSDACEQVITVDAVDELDITVELQNVSAGPFTRCIHIELHDCLGGEPHVIEQTMTFSGGVASAKLEVPCGEWVCITARDPLHTLRSTVEPLSVSGQQYIASFTGAEALRGGNLNDPASNVIDIFDFGAFAGEFNENYGSGNTDCDDVPPHADISGDGVVFVEDYTFIVNNFLDVSEPNCCGLGGIAGGDEPPVISISVAELEAMGLGSYAAGDLNGDGWLNPIDMQLFADGVWPTDDSTVREVSFTGASGGSWFDPANWSDGLLPDDQADVAIDVNVTIDDGEAIARHIDINSGAALSIANSGSIAAMSITVHGGGMLALDDASALITADSLVIDHGAMLAWHSGVIAADLVNSGVIELGNPLAQLMLDAEFTQLLPGVLAIDIAGELDSMHDALIVTGPAHLGGTLEVRLLEGYVPAIDSKITSVIEAQIIMGQFDQVIPPDQLLPGVFQHLAISETAVHIIYSDEPQMPADLDGDGVIGSADLAELLSQWGECLLPLPPGEGGGEGGTDSGGVPALCTADFNADGVIDSADLAQLLSAWSN
jgi:hypothetical protein